MKLLKLITMALAALSLALGAPFAPVAMADDSGELTKEKAEKAHPFKPPYSPYVGRDFPTRPFFGDTHLHTSFSMDAGAFGARIGPRDAYRFARGEDQARVSDHLPGRRLGGDHERPVRDGRAVDVACAERLEVAHGDWLTAARDIRSEERRVGKECDIPCRSRWSPYH